VDYNGFKYSLNYQQKEILDFGMILLMHTSFPYHQTNKIYKGMQEESSTKDKTLFFHCVDLFMKQSM
jgi:hypothetical protein